MHVCSGAYANNVKCVHTGIPVNIVDFTGFIGDIHTDIDVSYVNMN